MLSEFMSNELKVLITKSSGHLSLCVGASAKRV